METLKNEPWNFCETPEEKCTMNYCDENGCQNRKRHLVEPKINPWKTIEEIDNGLKKAREEYLLSKKKSKAATFILGKIDKAIENSEKETSDEVLQVETIRTDNSAVIDQLKADKEELLEALEDIANEYGINPSGLESLLQKHKQ